MSKKYLGTGTNCFQPASNKNPTAPLTLDDQSYESIKSVFSVLSDATNSLPDNYADVLRDAALKLECEDLNIAHDLMELAHIIRPNGPFINKKLNEYKNRLYKIT